MDETAIKVPTTVVSTASKVHPILKRDPHHKPGGGASSDNAARAAASSSGGNDNMTSSTTPGKEDRHLTWDEHAIEEHDQLRGTRMKIDEPDTPYTNYEHHSDDDASNSSGIHPRSPDENHPSNQGAAGHALLAANWDDVSSKLQAVAAKRDAAPLSPAPSRDSNNGNSDDDDYGGGMGDGERRGKDEGASARERKFKDMRKKHYNEAEAMRRWRAEHADDDDDDDEEDDDMEE